MKRIVSVVMAMVLCLALCSCVPESSSGGQHENYHFALPGRMVLAGFG